VNSLSSLDDVHSLKVAAGRLHSAEHEEILAGHTTDVYFIRTRDVLRSCGLLETEVVAEVFARGSGCFAGGEEVLTLLKDRNLAIEILPEGESFASKDVVLRIRGPYGSFGAYETVLLGMLASATGWATAARECVEAAKGKKVLCFGARHVHPAVAPVMERVAMLVGGCQGASCILGAKLGGQEPQGTIPHAAILVAGDTLSVASAYDALLEEGDPRIVLVDTFKDEAEEALRVARALEGRLTGIRLDTPSERGGVTPGLIREVRARLDGAGFPEVRIFVSGGLNPDRISRLVQEPVDAFGVGSYIAHGVTRDMTMDIKEIEGKPIAKRGRIPGIQENPKLRRVL
jgi:nicotinate phosphoribosyltransferase